MAALAGLQLAGPVPAQAGPRRPRFRLAEAYARRLVWTRDGKGRRVYELAEEGFFRLHIRVPLDEVDVAAFNETTRVRIEIEENVFDVALGDDAGYFAGRLHSVVKRTAVDKLGNELVYQTIRLKWDRWNMHLFVETFTPTQAEPLFGWEFLDRLTGRYADESEAVVTVAGQSTLFALDLSSRTVTRIARRNQQQFEVSNVSISGKGAVNDFEG